MLILSRKPSEAVLIGGNVVVRVLGVRGNVTRLGFEAPAGMNIVREELAPEVRVAPETAPDAAERIIEMLSSRLEQVRGEGREHKLAAIVLDAAIVDARIIARSRRVAS